jgi:pyrroline-5-carboxylate reductase
MEEYSKKINILLVGCGNIGKSLLEVIDENNNIVVVQPSLSNINKFPKVTFIDNLSNVNNFNPDVVILTVKPQVIDEILPQLKKYKNSIIISMLAGVKIKKFNDFKKVIRIMPNIAIKIANSINLAIAGDGDVIKNDIEMVENILKPSGTIVWLDKENDIDNLTSIYGSGPAYIFLLAELLMRETMKFGFDENLSRHLVEQLFIGSVGLIKKNNNFEELKKSVMSKGGCTESALKILTPALEKILSDSLKSSLDRIKELGDYENSN